MFKDETLQKWETEYKKGFSKPFILLTLAEKSNYPYSLTRDITSKSKGQIAIAGSNIYPILKDLVDEGLLKSEKAPKPIKKEKDSKKQYRTVYSLTKTGEEFLNNLKDSLKEFITIINEFIEK